MTPENRQSFQDGEKTVQDLVKRIGELPVSRAAGARAVVKARRLASTAQTVERRQYNTIPTIIGAFLMHHRISLLATAASVLVVATWISSLLSPHLAMAETAKAIREARSYILKQVDIIGEQPNCWETMYWRSDGKRRSDTTTEDGEILRTMVGSTDGPGVYINHETKVYFLRNSFREPVTALGRFEKLSRFAGDADRVLGTRRFGETAAKGFEIDLKKIDPHLYNGKAHIWIDPATNLPLEIEYHLTGQFPGDARGRVKFHDIRWNIDIDDQVFDTTPPKGYTKRTRPATPLDDQLEMICTSFRNYAELMGGHYPRVKLIDPDFACYEMAKQHGIDFAHPTDDDIRTEAWGKIKKAELGFVWLYQVFRLNPTIRYHGQTVTSDDKDDVLVSWRLDDGSYLVIFGDLRNEAVTVKRLKALEAQQDTGKTSSASPPKHRSLMKGLQPTSESPRLPVYFWYEAPAMHWRVEVYDVADFKSKDPASGRRDPPIDAEEKGWFLPNVGFRFELRNADDELTRVIVQNQKWRYVWDVKHNAVTAKPPRAKFVHDMGYCGMITARTKRRVISDSTSSDMRGTYVTEMDIWNGKPAEKLTFKFLADPNDQGFSPIHDFRSEFEEFLKSPDAKFRTRIYWFDPETHLIVGRRCGCEASKHVEWIEYPESISPELFTFQVPTDAQLRVEDDDLGRVITSEGTAARVRGSHPIPVWTQRPSLVKEVLRPMWR